MNTKPQPRNPMQPYTIPLQAPYYLPYRSLSDHITKKDGRHKNFRYEFVQLASFKEGVVLLEAGILPAIQVLRIKVAPDALTVQCDCDLQVEKLCYHTYSVLEWLALTKGDYFFENFAPLGPLALAQQYPAWFTTSKNGLSGSLKDPKTGLYLPGSEEAEKLQLLLNPWYPPVMQYRAEVPADIVVGYCVSCSGRYQHLPVIIPFWAKLNKSGTGIKQFIGFFHKQKELPALRYTHHQQMLNVISAEMLQLANDAPGNLDAEAKYQPAIASLYHLWQQALPLLAAEQHVYCTHMYHFKKLPAQPSRQRMLPATISTQAPCITVQLGRDKGVMTIKAFAGAGGKKLKPLTANGYLLPVYQNNRYILRLFASMRDALLWDMQQQQGSLHVFPPAQQEACNNFLQQAGMYYPLQVDEGLLIKTIRLKPKERIISMSVKDDWYIFTASIVYHEGTKVNIHTNGTMLLQNHKGQLQAMLRDKDAEKQMQEVLYTIHPTLQQQSAGDVLVLHRTEVSSDTLLHIKKLLVKNKIKTEGFP